MAKVSSVAFRNLRAEMARKEITLVEMASYLGISRDTLAGKLSGRRSINLDEALRIAKEFFPEYDLYYLFSEITEDKQTA